MLAPEQDLSADGTGSAQTQADLRGVSQLRQGVRLRLENDADRDAPGKQPEAQTEEGAGAGDRDPRGDGQGTRSQGAGKVGEGLMLYRVWRYSAMKQKWVEFDRAHNQS